MMVLRYFMSLIMLSSMTTWQTNLAFADGDGNQPAREGKCARNVREVRRGNNQELKDAVVQYWDEGATDPTKKLGWSDTQFCNWLAKRLDGDTEAGTFSCRTCDNPEPPDETVRSIPPDVRRRIREVARPAPPPPEVEPVPVAAGTGGGLFGGAFMQGFLGGALGGFLGTMIGGRLNGGQQQSMFPPPQWGGQWGRPQPMPFPGGQFAGAPGVMPFPGTPGVMPFPGVNQYGGAPGAISPWGGNLYGGGYQNYGYNNYGYNNNYAFGGGYRSAPSVLPLAPQSYSPYSVSGSIPQTHWSLINAGR